MRLWVSNKNFLTPSILIVFKEKQPFKSFASIEVLNFIKEMESSRDVFKMFFPQWFQFLQV